MRKALFALIFAAVVVMLLPADVFADGFVVITSRRPIVRKIPQPWTPLAVKYHKVKVDIRGNIATTEIDQVFINLNNRQLEGEYIFPVPPGAAISQFSMWMGDKEVQGEMLPREKARAIYEGIVRRMKDPALLEYVDRGIFRAKVFPIPARGETHIKLTYSETLKSEANLIRYRYPLNTEKFSSKPLQDVLVSCTIHNPTPIKNVVCPSHKVDVARTDDTHVKVSYEDKNVKPDKDFFLYYSVSDKEFGLSVDAFKKPAEDMFFYMMLAPKIETGKSDILSKDVVFVFDTSGSMAQDDKIKQQAKALKYCLSQLNKNDRFNLVAFSTQSTLFRDKLQDVDDEIVKAAKLFVDEQKARGGTNINDSLEEALKMGEDGRPLMVVLLTDGEPTLGRTVVPDEIIKNVKKANDKRVRVFSLGIGAEINVHLLDRLSEENYGATEYLSPKENMEIKISAFYDKISFPVLSEASVEIKGLETYDVYPAEIGDVFKGQQITVLGRAKKQGTKAVILKGRVNGKEREYVFECKFKSTEDASYIPVLWANRKIAYMLDNIRLHGEKKEVKDEIIRLATRYGIMTPYTSYLVTEDVKRHAMRPGRHSTPGTPGSPSGPSSPGASRALAGRLKADADSSEAVRPMGQTMREAEKSFKRGFSTPTGEGAANASKNLKKAKENTTAELDDQGSAGIMVDRHGNRMLQRIGDKAFFKSGGVWIDSVYDKKKHEEIKVKAWSDEFFKLLKEIPKLGEYFAVGDKVIVVHKDKAYIVE